ncbi:MAG: hypothetical protein V3R94_11510 [Acidobacteriota bacterium]
MTRRKTVFVIVLFMITGSLWAQERQFQRNPLRSLKGGLQAAGAPELTSDQEEQLRALLAEFRQTNGAERPGPEIREAHQAYQNAVLNSDVASAQLQAEIIANHSAAATVSKLEAQARLKIRFLSLLTQDQVDAVLQRNGTAGLFRLLGPSGSGRGQGGPGPSPYFRR